MNLQKDNTILQLNPEKQFLIDKISWILKQNTYFDLCLLNVWPRIWENQYLIQPWTNLLFKENSLSISFQDSKVLRKKRRYLTESIIDFIIIFLTLILFLSMKEVYLTVPLPVTYVSERVSAYIQKEDFITKDEILEKIKR